MNTRAVIRALALLTVGLVGCKNPFVSQSAQPAQGAAHVVPKEPAAICASLQSRVQSNSIKDQDACAKTLGEMRAAFPPATWDKLTICLDKGTDEKTLDNCVKSAMDEAARTAQ